MQRRAGSMRRQYQQKHRQQECIDRELHKFWCSTVTSQVTRRLYCIVCANLKQRWQSVSVTEMLPQQLLLNPFIGVLQFTVGQHKYSARLLSVM
uniref:Uncharacterized protein n=1 Tax=Arundo donax TaxID=35708 RepID=A0A0A9AG02_ARUDO